MSRHTEQFKACESILGLAESFHQSNAEKVRLNTSRHASLAVLALYAKARKQIIAVHLLVSRGYGEDAMIVARSLVNLCIDLGCITADPDQIEVRARRWTAKGRVERRRFAKRVGTTPPDEAKVNWSAEETLADEWPPKIIDRAVAAGLENFYNLPYRHGSSFEHSDSWSATSFLDLNADVVDMMSGPSDRFVDLALLTLACSVGEITWLVGKFYDFDHTSAIVEMIRTLVKNAFPTKEGQP